MNIKNKISVCIVIPTYNEVHNIKKLLGSLYSKERVSACREENIMMDVLVVDDNSPDGTANAVKSFQKKNSHVHLLLRSEKNGLGAAYIAGMQHAVSLLRPDVIFEMDADLSHDPEYILPMIGEIRDGGDFIIGSRYIAGGSLPKEWGMRRRLISKAANFYAKTVLRIKNVQDCTGGFRAIRNSVIQKIDLNSLNVKGYVFQISLLDSAMRNGFIIKEVPIAFHDRTDGKSKMGVSDIIEVAVSVLRTALSRNSYQAGSIGRIESEKAPFEDVGKVAHHLTKI